jgi:calcineurin-like phosphoesterase family protein
MSAKVYFISDLHLGHNKILNFSGDYRGGTTTEEHDEWIINQWNSVVTKRDVVYVLGDVAFTREGLDKCRQLHGYKKLILGNHDKYMVSEYMTRGFKILSGIVKYKRFWLSHAPIHPNELRGLINIHGHVHSQSIDDLRYINVCVEPLNGIPLFLEELRNKYPSTRSN